MSQAREAQDRAARWIIAREDATWSDCDEAEFAAWLGESDFNRITWLRLDEGWRQTDRIKSLGADGADMSPDPVVHFRPVARGTGERRWWVSAAIAASLALVMGVGWTAFMGEVAPSPAPVVAEYETAVGGRRLIGLTDGSQVELNTASEVRATVSAERRAVWLDRGEAYFEIAHDEKRPFVVYAGTRAITVLGTKFLVRRDGAKVTVSVVEGRVRVTNVGRDGVGRSTTITDGDIAVAQGASTLVTAKSGDQVNGALAWREGMFAFDQTRLSEIAAEFNRYNHKRLVVTGTEAPEIRIGGTFPVTRPRAFVSLLRDAYGLKVEETDDMIKISD